MRFAYAIAGSIDGAAVDRARGLDERLVVQERADAVDALVAPVRVFLAEVAGAHAERGRRLLGAGQAAGAQEVHERVVARARGRGRSRCRVARARRTCGSARSAAHSSTIAAASAASKHGSSTTTGAVTTTNANPRRPGSPGPRAGRVPAVASAAVSGSRVATVGLVVLTCVLTLVSTLALWLRALVLNTDSYVRAIGPVLDHPAVRDALAETIVAELYSHVDVTAQLRTALPKSGGRVRADARREHPHHRRCRSRRPRSRPRRCGRCGAQANRVAHDQVVHVLEGKGRVVTTAKGEVAIDTGALAADGAARARRERDPRCSMPSRPSALDRRFVLFRSTDLDARAAGDACARRRGDVASHRDRLRSASARSCAATRRRRAGRVTSRSASRDDGGDRDRRRRRPRVLPRPRRRRVPHDRRRAVRRVWSGRCAPGPG